MKKLFNSKKAEGNITDVIINVILGVALIPVIIFMLNSTQGLSQLETIIIGVGGVFLTLGLAVSVARKTGFINPQ